jgi:hypothetical protein
MPSLRELRKPRRIFARMRAMSRKGSIRYRVSQLPGDAWVPSPRTSESFKRLVGPAERQASRFEATIGFEWVWGQRAGLEDDERDHATGAFVVTAVAAVGREPSPALTVAAGRSRSVAPGKDSASGGGRSVTWVGWDGKPGPAATTRPASVVAQSAG